MSAKTLICFTLLSGFSIGVFAEEHTTPGGVPSHPWNVNPLPARADGYNIAIPAGYRLVVTFKGSDQSGWEQSIAMWDMKAQTLVDQHNNFIVPKAKISQENKTGGMMLVLLTGAHKQSGPNSKGGWFHSRPSPTIILGDKVISMETDLRELSFDVYENGKQEGIKAVLSYEKI